MDIELILIVLGVPLALIFLRWLFKTKLFLVLFYVPFKIIELCLIALTLFFAYLASGLSQEDEDVIELEEKLQNTIKKISDVFN